MDTFIEDDESKRYAITIADAFQNVKRKNSGIYPKKFGDLPEEFFMNKATRESA